MSAPIVTFADGRKFTLATGKPLTAESLVPLITEPDPRAELIKEIEGHGVVLARLVARLRKFDELDQRWISIGCTDLQTGLMALTRGVTKPTSF